MELRLSARVREPMIVLTQVVALPRSNKFANAAHHPSSSNQERKSTRDQLHVDTVATTLQVNQVVEGIERHRTLLVREVKEMQKKRGSDENHVLEAGTHKQRNNAGLLSAYTIYPIL